MVILTSKQFHKAYAKLPDQIQAKFKERRNIFWRNPFNPILRNHALVGNLVGFRSIDITGDYRLIYKQLDKNTYLFALIGTHSQLY